MVTPIQPAPQQRRWHTFATIGELEQSVTEVILAAAKAAITSRDSFHIVLAGGTTPHNVYRLLRETRTEWNKWHIYFGDERCLPPDHAERNSLMAQEAWLGHVAIPCEQVHIIPSEMGAESAAIAYAKTLEKVGIFDLVLLGLGEDGHTASLFPGQDWGLAPESPDAIPVHEAPKPPLDRVSLSAHRLGEANQVLFTVTGNAKKQAIRNWRAEGNIPAACIKPAAGVDIYLEASLLEE